MSEKDVTGQAIEEKRKLEDYLLPLAVVGLMIGIGVLIMGSYQEYESSCFGSCMEKTNMSFIALNEMCNPNLGWECSPTPVCGTEAQYQEFKQCINKCNGSIENYEYEGEKCVGVGDKGDSSG